MASQMEHAKDEAHAHPKHLAHHFDTPAQQFESAKSGMWLFLSTEILLFSGLFCAYAVYRANHPEVFIYAHQFLDKTMGGINTVILILSSLTAAWAVRAAQLGQRKLLIVLIFATLLCACGFMGIKAVEYEHKWKHGLLWGKLYNPTEHAAPAGGGEHAPASAGGQVPAGAGEQQATGAAVPPHPEAAERTTTAQETGAAPHGDAAPASHTDAVPPAGAAAPATDPLNIHSNIRPAAQGPRGLATSSSGVSPGTHSVSPGPAAVEHAVGSESAAAPAGAPPAAGFSSGGSISGGSISGSTASAPAGASGPGSHAAHSEPPRNVQVFFSIYFIMTGLHGVHVVAGMIAFAMLLPRAFRGEFNGDYFTPVDLTALYWHLVDLIWIYLFPLLYLIH